MLSRISGSVLDETPVVEAVLPLHLVVKGATTEDLLQGDVLLADLLGIGFGDLEPARQAVCPVDLGQERVALDLFSAALARAKALDWIPVQQL